MYDKLVNLCVDICKRNGKTKLLWLGSKEKALAYEPFPNEMVLSAHRWFANKSCPGEWLYSRFGDLAVRVMRELNTGADDKKLYRVQIGAFGSKENAENYAKKAEKAGFPAIVKTETVNGKTLYRVQCGAFSDYANAENFVKDLKKAGFDAIIKEA